MKGVAVTREEIGWLADAIANIPKGTLIKDVPRFVGDLAENAGCSREVARFGEALVSMVLKATPRP